MHTSFPFFFFLTHNSDYYNLKMITMSQHCIRIQIFIIIEMIYQLQKGIQGFQSLKNRLLFTFFPINTLLQYLYSHLTFITFRFNYNSEVLVFIPGKNSF